jgi:hypothetical protein
LTPSKQDLGENVDVAASRRAHEVLELSAKARGEHCHQLLAVGSLAAPKVSLKGARQGRKNAWIGFEEVLSEGTGTDGGAECVGGRCFV